MSRKDPGVVERGVEDGQRDRGRGLEVQGGEVGPARVGETDGELGDQGEEVGEELGGGVEGRGAELDGAARGKVR